MNSESMTLFSPQLAARLDALVKKYPVKRSALVPMLLYAQDEVGYLSDAVIAEVAERVCITELDIFIDRRCAQSEAPRHDLYFIRMGYEPRHGNLPPWRDNRPECQEPGRDSDRRERRS